MKKKCLLGILSCIMLVIILTGCGNSAKNELNRSAFSITQNVANGGYVCFDDNRVYYLGCPDSDSSGFMLSKSVFSTDLNGNNRETLLKEANNIATLRYCDGYLYMGRISLDDNSYYIDRMNLANKSMEQVFLFRNLNTLSNVKFSIHDNRLFYLNRGELGVMTVGKADNTVIESGVTDFVNYFDNIYIAKNDGIYDIIDRSENLLVKTNGSASRISVNGNVIFYLDKDGLKKTDLASNKTVLLKGGELSFYLINDDKVYYGRRIPDEEKQAVLKNVNDSIERLRTVYNEEEVTMIKASLAASLDELSDIYLTDLNGEKEEKCIVSGKAYYSPNGILSYYPIDGSYKSI